MENIWFCDIYLNVKIMYTFTVIHLHLYFSSYFLIEMEHKFQKYKFQNLKDDSQTMIELKKQLENQEHNCYICNDSIALKKEDIIRTPCNHIYHFECLYYSFYKNSTNHHKKYKLREIRQCPYCRHFIQSLLPKFKPNVYPPCYKVTEDNVYCSAIVKSGKKKGLTCGCACKMGSAFCGRHKNSVEITEKEDEYYLIM